MSTFISRANYKNTKELTIQRQVSFNQEIARKEFRNVSSVVEEISVPSIISSTNDWQTTMNPFGTMDQFGSMTTGGPMTMTNEGEFDQPQMNMGMMGSMMMGQPPSVMNTGYDEGDWRQPTQQANVFEQEEKDQFIEDNRYPSLCIVCGCIKNNTCGSSSIIRLYYFSSKLQLQLDLP